MDQKKWKSPVFWAGVVSAVALVAKLVFDYQVPVEQIDNLINAVFGLIAVFSAANNPNSKSHF